MTDTYEDATPFQTALARHQAQLDGLKELTGGHQKILISHESMLSVLGRDLKKQDDSLEKLYNRLSELHGENKARADMLVERQAEGAAAIRQLDDRMAKLGSMKHWVAWVLIIVSSSAAYQIIEKLTNRH